MPTEKKKDSSPSKAETQQMIAETTGLTKKQVDDVFEALRGVIQTSIRRHGSYTLDGMIKIERKAVPAKPARQGINPRTKEPIMIKAKPASVTVKAKSLKKLKDMA